MLIKKNNSWEGIVDVTHALSLRNFVLRYDCCRVFPAKVGLGSPSRDAAN